MRDTIITIATVLFGLAAVVTIAVIIAAVLTRVALALHDRLARRRAHRTVEAKRLQRIRSQQEAADAQRMAQRIERGKKRHV